MKKLQAFLAAVLLAAASISSISSSAAFDLENLPEGVFVYDNWLYTSSLDDNSVILIGVVDRTVTSVTVPAEINGIPVTDLVDGSVGYRKNLDLGSCYNLKEILVDEESEYFEVVDGALVSKLFREVYAYPRACEKEVYTTPENVYTVNDIFNYCHNLKELTISETMSKNQNSSGMVSHCNSLEKITTMGVLSIVSFRNCPNLKEINLKAPEEPALVTAMRFTGLESLETLSVPENYEIYSTLLIQSCPELRELSLPCDVVGNAEVFVVGCDSLETLDLSEIDVKSPAQEGSLEAAYYPDDYFKQAKLTISNCPKLKELKLMDAKEYTILDCPELTSLSFDTTTRYTTIQLQSQNSSLQDLYFYSPNCTVEIVDSKYKYPGYDYSAQRLDPDYLSLADMGVTIHCRRDDTDEQDMCERHNIPYVIIEDEIVPGDVGNDGELDILDVVMLNRVVVGVDRANPSKVLAGDLNGNGKLELTDSMAILRKLVGLDA